MNISFTGKIPLYQTKVLDKKSQTLKDAKIYELDGNDKSDIDYVVLQTGNWGQYKTYIAQGIHKKVSDLAKGKNNCGINTRFYTLEATDGKSIGLMETASIGPYTGISFLECSPEKDYKYAGQVMLASLAKSIACNNDSLIFINDPADNARKFYTDKCGFTSFKENSRELIMNRCQMRNFIKNVEEKTQQPILNLSA